MPGQQERPVPETGDVDHDRMFHDQHDRIQNIRQLKTSHCIIECIRARIQRSQALGMAMMSADSGFGQLLRVNPLFSNLGPKVIDCLSAMATTRTLQPGEILFQVDDPGDALYGVRRGEIRIETGTEAGRRIVLNSLGAGDLFGEIALLDGRERTADAVAAVASELFVLRRPDLLAYLTREPDVAIRLIGLLCSRIRYIAGQMTELATLSLGARLARRLVVLAEDFGNEIEISQEQLGAFVGGTRESVNRQLQVWRRAGYIELRRGCIVLLKAEALARMAHEPSCA